MDFIGADIDARTGGAFAPSRALAEMTKGFLKAPEAVRDGAAADASRRIVKAIDAWSRRSPDGRARLARDGALDPGFARALRRKVPVPGEGFRAFADLMADELMAVVEARDGEVHFANGEAYHVAAPPPDFARWVAP